MATPTKICLYTAMTPNGHKISIALEELGLSYDVKPIRLPAMEHKSPCFMEISPNGRVPAMTDILPDGTEVKLFESGSIMQYIVERYDVDHKISYPRGTKEFYQTNSWLFWQNAGLGQMQCQLAWFTLYGPTEWQDFAIDPYTKELKRLHNTLETHLNASKADFIVGNKFTIADVAVTAWTKMMPFANLDIAEFPRVKGWYERIQKRLAVQRGINAPHKTPKIASIKEDPETFQKYHEMQNKWAKNPPPAMMNGKK